MAVVEPLYRSEDWGVRACPYGSEELSGFDYCNGFIFQVLVVSGGFFDYLFHHLWGCLQPLQEVVHHLPASHCVTCLPNQCFEVADVLVNKGELEIVFVEGCLGSLLLGGVHELGLEVMEKVGVGVFDVVLNGVELFYHLKHCFHPSVDLWPFDECKGDGDASDW